MPKKSFFAPLSPDPTKKPYGLRKYKQTIKHPSHNILKAASEIPLKDLGRQEDVERYDEIVRKAKERLFKKLSS